MRIFFSLVEMHPVSAVRKKNKRFLCIPVATSISWQQIQPGCVKLLIHAVFRFINEMWRRLMRLAPVNSHIKPREAEPRSQPITVSLATIGSPHPCSRFNFHFPRTEKLKDLSISGVISRGYFSLVKLALNEQSALDNLLFSGTYKPKDRHLTWGGNSVNNIKMVVGRLVYCTSPLVLQNVWKDMAFIITLKRGAHLLKCGFFSVTIKLLMELYVTTNNCRCCLSHTAVM